ncbi:MAG: DUF6285 domain-containing protein, partial [Burkholderiaceae bacterium]
ILDVVAKMIRDDFIPRLPPDAVFHARVAANAIDLVRRQLEQGDALEAASLERLQALLGQSGSAESLERELCERIRDRRLGMNTPGLIEHLMADTLAKMSIDQPSYASYRAEISNS